MSDEEITPEAETPVERPPEDNPLFKALFEAAEEPDAPEVAEPAEPVEPVEPVAVPQTLNQALDSMWEPEEESVQVTEQEPEPVQQAAEPVKSEPKKKKVKQVVDPDVPHSAPDPSFHQPPEDPDKEFAEGLLPEEREIFNMAKYASSNMEGYDGADAQFKKYFTNSKEYIEKRLRDDPHVDLSEDDEYKAFVVRNRPKFGHADARKVEHAMIADKAEKAALDKLQPELERVKLEQSRAQRAPMVLETKQKLRQTARGIIPEEYRPSLDTKEGLEKLATENPFEYQIMDSVTNHLTGLADIFVDITQGAVDYNPNDQVHTKLLGWVNDEQENFINSGQTHKEGKVFMRRERFHQLPENKRTEYYTWSDEDLLMILALRAKETLDTNLKSHYEALENAGYARGNGQAVAAQQPQQPQQPAPRQEPPRAQSAPRQGGGVAGQPVNPPSNALLQSLGL
jgi:hypothetical protein